MRFTLPGLLVCVVAGSVPAQDVKVAPAGLRIVRTTYGKNFSGVRPFNQDKGTAVAVMLSAPGGGLIEIDTDNSKLEVQVHSDSATRSGFQKASGSNRKSLSW